MPIPPRLSQQYGNSTGADGSQHAKKTPTSIPGGAAPATSSATAPSTRARTGSSGSTPTPGSASATTRPVSVRAHCSHARMSVTHISARKTGDHGYGEGIEVLLDPAGMAYRLNGEPLVARDAKIGPYHVNVKGKHKILARGRARP
ncbi:hypothetical protein FRC10_010924 [Ceratobasidium sp. 414]|nr:hypothetical protein FRC10_010924 [Ceratobasidium sp. 414]